MHATDSERRGNEILEAVIEAYVSTASPVGSEHVCRRLRQSVSPATIRHVMGELEEEGFLEQPHTSAGRVPTERGYRHYVDTVMEVPRLSAEELRALEAAIASDEWELGPLLQRAADALAALTHQAAVVLAPTVKHSTVKQIELVPLSVKKILCVLIANEEIVASHVVETEEIVSRDQAVALARFVNTELVGVPFHEILRLLERRLLAEHDSLYQLVRQSFAILQHALSMEPEDRLLMTGASYAVSQPEFRKDPERAQMLLRGLDEESALLSYLRQELPERGVRVRIGREVGLPDLRGCSILSASFKLGDELLGGVGVIGPTRMDYRRMWAAVEGMARSVTAALVEWEF